MLTHQLLPNENLGIKASLTPRKKTLKYLLMSYGAIKDSPEIN